MKYLFLLLICVGCTSNTSSEDCATDAGVTCCTSDGRTCCYEKHITRCF